MKSVLITGAAGFIGFHLAKYHQKLSHSVWIIDNLSKNKNRIDSEFLNLKKNKNISFVNIDLTKKINTRTLPKEFDIVYHLAAINGTELFYLKPYDICQNNILVTINLLKYISKIKISKLIYSSTSEVYSGAEKYKLLKFPTKENAPVVFPQPTDTRYSYATSKFLGEFLSLQFGKENNIPTSVIRFHNIYGPRMGDKHAIPQIFYKILNNKRNLNVIGAFETRAYCYIDDAVSALYKLSLNNRGKNSIIHIGNSNEEITSINLAKKMMKILGKKLSLKNIPSRSSSVKRRLPDIKYLKSITDFKPLVNLDKGLELTISWYLKNAKK